jgi:uncharacterized membrane protein YozB (DUF420 family)
MSQATQALLPTGSFSHDHRWDRNFFLAILAAIWAAIIIGFGVDIPQRHGGNIFSYPLVVHLHALVFVGWLALLTSQIVLIRKGDYATHKRFGVAALVLLPLMVVLGPATAIVVDQQKFGHPMTAFPFMITQFTNVLGCTVLFAAALLLRRDGGAHKRLMLMGTIAITEPGFSRVIWKPLYAVFGDGFGPYMIETYIGTIVLMLALGVYDVVTRGRLHPAYVAAFVWVLANEMTAAWMYYQPWWATATTHLLGH